jgi:hypothetical protein
MFIITADPVKKNGARFLSYTEGLWIVIYGTPYFLTTGLHRAPDWDCFHFQYYSAKPAFA